MRSSLQKKVGARLVLKIAGAKAGKRMNERKAVERVVSRIYRQHLKAKGSLPDKNAVRSMEKKAMDAARSADAAKRRR